MLNSFGGEWLLMEGGSSTLLMERRASPGWLERVIGGWQHVGALVATTSLCWSLMSNLSTALLLVGSLVFNVLRVAQMMVCALKSVLSSSLLQSPQSVSHPECNVKRLLLFHSRAGSRDERGDLASAGGEPAPERRRRRDVRPCGQPPSRLEVAQMAHGDLEHVRLLQPLHPLPAVAPSCLHQVLELLQAGVDPRPSLPLQQRLHHLPVLVGGGDCLVTLHAERSG